MECCICLEALANENNYAALMCSHNLHYTCLRTKILYDIEENRIFSSCPVCRKIIGFNQVVNTSVTIQIQRLCTMFWYFMVFFCVYITIMAVHRNQLSHEESQN